MAEFGGIPQMHPRLVLDVDAKRQIAKQRRYPQLGPLFGLVRQIVGVEIDDIDIGDPVEGIKTEQLVPPRLRDDATRQAGVGKRDLVPSVQYRCNRRMPGNEAGQLPRQRNRYLARQMSPASGLDGSAYLRSPMRPAR